MLGFTPTSHVLPFLGWTAFTPVIPSLYYDVRSSEERIKKICCELHKLCEYSSMLAENINLDHKLIDELQDAFERFINGEFDDFYKREIEAWINANIERLISKGLQHVYPAINEDGHFVIYVPDSWSDVQFDFGAVYGRDDYGRIILRMNVSEPGTIDNTYSYSLAQKPSDFQAMVRDLELVTKRSDATFNAMFTNMNEVVSSGDF